MPVDSQNYDRPNDTPLDEASFQHPSQRARSRHGESSGAQAQHQIRAAGLDQSIDRHDGDRSELDTTMIMLNGLIDGSLQGLAIYHLLKADLLMIRGLPETRSHPIRNSR